MAAMEKDPLITRANRTLKESQFYTPEAGKTVMQGSLLFMLPFLSFVAMVAGFYHYFHHSTPKFAAVFGVLMAVSIMFAFLSGGKKPWLIRLCFLCIISTLAAICVGFFFYYKYLLYYNAYGDMRSYTNVAASQQASQFEDAAMLLFTSDTQVDTTRAVGFRDAKSASTICVAPVVDSSMGETDPISFWAVGTNCCEPRAHFQCDGATKGGARAALLLLDTDVLVSPALESFVLTLGGHSPAKYDNAIRLDKAAYGTVSAKNIRFLRWTDDPHALQANFRLDGLEVMYHSIIIAFFVCLFVGIAVTPRKGSTPKKTAV